MNTTNTNACPVCGAAERRRVSYGIVFECGNSAAADGRSVSLPVRCPHVPSVIAALRDQLVQAQARGDTYRRRALVLVRRLSKRKKPKVSMPGAYKRVVGIWRLRDSDAVARAERSMDRDMDDYLGHSIAD